MKRFVTLLFFLAIAGNLLAQRDRDSTMIVNGVTCIYYDFDGETVTGTAWNYYDTVIIAEPSSVNTDTAAMNYIVNYGKEIFLPFNVVVTRDSTLYFLAQEGKRIRVIFTPTYQWYCGATPCVGGVSYIGSMYWGDDTPSWVFDALGSTRKRSIVGIHEAGHQFGLNHYDVAGIGSGETGLVPIMNANNSLYTQNMTLWWQGLNVQGFQQDDVNTIMTEQDFTQKHKKLNDIGTVFNHARHINKNQTYYAFISANDSDYYRIRIDTPQSITISVVPKGNGSNSFTSVNADATLDAAIDLYDESENLIVSSSNSTTLNASLTQSLPRGVYFIKVRPDRDNTNNPSGYGFLGHYWITYTN